MKFLINKVSKKYICLVTRENYIFNSELYEIIETDLFINNDFLVNKWNGSEWIEGATPEEIAEANKPIVPQVISRRQFKLALAFLGYNENDILNGIDQLPEPNKTIARISYLESGTFERFSSELIYVGKNFLHLTDEQIDEVFITGNTF